MPAPEPRAGEASLAPRRPVRRAGRSGEPDGSLTIWSVAEGRSGRRWRWRTIGPVGDAGAWLAATLETDPRGAFSKLEVAAPAGLLTLHREADGSTHGNVVRDGGVTHLALGADVGAVLVAGSRLGLAAVVASLGRAIPVGAEVSRDVLLVDRRLVPARSAIRVRRVTATAWHLAPPGPALGGPLELDGTLELDGDTLPAPIASDEGWPLEAG